jgi:hypothetical protein
MIFIIAVVIWWTEVSRQAGECAPPDRSHMGAFGQNGRTIRHRTSFVYFPASLRESQTDPD